MSNETIKRYLANKHGTGIANNITEHGTHKTVDAVLNAYSAGGQEMPAGMMQQIDELRNITRSESELQNLSPEARHTMALGGSYDALGVQRRERELVKGLLNGARGVMTEPAALELKRSRASTTIEQNNAERSNALQEGAIRNGKLQQDANAQGFIAQKLQNERLVIQSQTELRQMRSQETARELLPNLSEVSTYDMVAAIESGDPALATEVFGADIDRETQLNLLSLRGARDNQQVDQRTGGRKRDASALSGNDIIDQEANALAELNFVRQEALIRESGPELGAMSRGEIPLPTGIEPEHVQEALMTFEKRRAEQNALELDAFNGILDIEGVTKGSGKTEDRVETGARIMSIASDEMLAEIGNNIRAGKEIELPVGDTDLTLKLTPQQAAAAFQEIEKIKVGAAKDKAMQELQARTAQTFNRQISDMTRNIKSANHGILPPKVDQALAIASEQLGAAVFGGTSSAALGDIMVPVENALRESGFTDDEEIETILSGKFVASSQVGKGAMTLLGMAPDFEQQPPAIANFLQSFKARSEAQGKVVGPNEMNKLFTMINDPALTGIEKNEQLRQLTGMDLADMRSMMKSSITRVNYAMGTEQFLANAADQGVLTPEQLSMVSDGLRGAVEERASVGEIISPSDYIQAAQTIMGTLISDPQTRAAANNLYYNSLRSVDAKTMLMRSDGTVDQDQAAFLTLINGGETSGAKSIPIQDIPIVLGAQFEEEIDRAVLGYQNLPQSRVHVGRHGVFTKGGTFQQEIIYKALLNNTKDVNNIVFEGSPDALFAHNPRLTQFITKRVVEQTLGAKQNQSFIESLFGEVLGDTEDRQTANVDIDAIMLEAAEAGLIEE